MVTGAGPQVNRARCTRCGACVELCERHVLALSEGLHVAHPAKCGYCGHCEEICPEGAISCEFTIVWGEAPENAHTTPGERPGKGG